VSLATAAAAAISGAARSVGTTGGATSGAGGSRTAFFFSMFGTPGPGVPAETRAGSSSSSCAVGSWPEPHWTWAEESASPKPGAYCSMSGGMACPALWI
jgi:hypothetical protein